MWEWDVTPKDVIDEVARWITISSPRTRLNHRTHGSITKGVSIEAINPMDCTIRSHGSRIEFSRMIEWLKKSRNIIESQRAHVIPSNIHKHQNILWWWDTIPNEAYLKSRSDQILPSLEDFFNERSNVHTIGRTTIDVWYPRVEYQWFFANVNDSNSADILEGCIYQSLQTWKQLEDLDKKSKDECLRIHTSENHEKYSLDNWIMSEVMFRDMRPQKKFGQSPGGSRFGW